MKFYLIIFFSCLAVFCSAQNLRLNTTEVFVDTIPYKIVNCTNNVTRVRQVKLTCTNNGKDAVAISRIVKSDHGHRSEVRNDDWNWCPQLCEPGKSYPIVLASYIYDSLKYIIYTSEHDSLIVKMRTERPVFIAFESQKTSWSDGIDGVPYSLERTVINRSDVPVTIDSIQRRGDKWECSALFPVTLMPDEKFALRFLCANDTGQRLFSSMQLNVFFHPEHGFTDFISSHMFVHSTHGVVATSATEQSFGTIRAGEKLTMKVIVKNNGWHQFDLQKNKSQFATCSKDILLPGDTATVTVEWNSILAKDSFRMEIPLFRDTRNGQCTVVMTGVAQRNFRARKKYVTPDEMIWVEARTIDLDTLKRSNYRVERNVKFKNNSPVTILVTNTTTGDGGSMAYATREPIRPGETFEVTFAQDLSSRIGPFTRGMSVQIVFLDGTNYSLMKVVTMKGFVVNDVVK